MMGLKSLCITLLALEQTVSSHAATPPANVPSATPSTAPSSNTDVPTIQILLGSVAVAAANGSSVVQPHAPLNTSSPAAVEKRQTTPRPMTDEEKLKEINQWADFFSRAPIRNDCFFVTAARLLGTTPQDVSDRMGVPIPQPAAASGGISMEDMRDGLQRLNANFRFYPTGERETRVGPTRGNRPDRRWATQSIYEAVALPPPGLPREAGVAYRRPDGSGHVVVVRNAGTPYRTYHDYQAGTDRPGGATTSQGTDVGSDVRNSRIVAYFAFDRASGPAQQDDDAMDVSPVTSDVLQPLRRGDYTALNCAAILSAFTLTKYLPGPKGKRSVQWLKRRANEDCDQARKILAEVTLQDTPPCQQIKDLEFGFRLSNDYWSGTYDHLRAIVRGSSGESKLDIAEAPERGFDKWFPVDLKAAFGADTIDLDKINEIEITAQGPSSGQTNDQFQIQDIQLRAKCADPGFSVNNGRLISLNQWYYHPSSFANWYNTAERTAAKFPVAAKDWVMTPSCTVLKNIQYEFKLDSAYWSGSDDAISFVLGDGKPVFIGEGLKLGTTKTGSIDLKAVYRVDKIDIRSLQKVDMIDKIGSTGKTDQWHFKGITFTGSCADTGDKLTMTKHADVMQWLGYDDKQPVVWTGPVFPQFWQKV